MPVYLDWNATTPPLPEVLAAMADAAGTSWGNPSSTHSHGRSARARVEAGRAAVAELTGADARDVVLTSGGTEANNIAVRSACRPQDSAVGAVPRLVTSRLEHPSITRVAEALEREARTRVRWLTVTPDGSIDLDDLERALREGPTALVAVQAVNHETGVVQPTAEVSRAVRAHGVLLHVDAVQAWGKIDLDPALGDTRALAGHKLRGPKGIGALLVRPGTHIEPLSRGGMQERGLRPGTIDPPSCAGLGVAARYGRTAPARYAAVAGLRDDLEARLVEIVDGARVNGGGPRVPHVTNIACPGWSAAELVAALDLEGVSVSGGSACSAGTSEPSPVLTAMLGAGRAACSVRLSLGDATTREDIDASVAAFARVLARAR